VEKGENVTIRNCAALRQRRVASAGSRDNSREQLHLDNGNVGSAFEHNTYTAVDPYQYNRFGPPLSGSIETLRIAPPEWLYVQLRGGNRQLDQSDAEDSVILQRPELFEPTSTETS
jgi:hypothetical protein